MTTLRADVARPRGEYEILADLAYVDALTGLANRVTTSCDRSPRSADVTT